VIKPRIRISIGAYKLNLRIEQELDELNGLISLHFVVTEQLKPVLCKYLERFYQAQRVVSWER